MTFQEVLSNAEIALAELARAQADTGGWTGQERRKFDAQRMKPLADSGVRLTVALKRAQEQSAVAERLLSE